MSNVATTDNVEMSEDSRKEVDEEPPLTKSDDSDACIDEIECYPKQYDCRNDVNVSESYNKFEQDMISIYSRELQAKQITADQQLQLIHQKSQLAQEKHDNKLSMAKLMTKQMNHHHRLQEQKYMHEIQTLRELFNRSEQKWELRMHAVDQQLLQQQTDYTQTVSELRDQIQQYNAQHLIYAAESQQSMSNFDNARLELNDVQESNQKIVHSLEAKIDLQTKDLLTFRADATTDKEEMELMVQSWMTQCEALQQQVHDFRTDLTFNKEAVQKASVSQEEMKSSIEKMGQTYENVLENVMEQIQEQTDVQNKNRIQLQASHDELRLGLELVNTTTNETLTRLEENIDLQAETLSTVHGKFEDLNEVVTKLQQNIQIADGNVTELKDMVNGQTTAQVKSQTDVNEIQSIVAKLADASNNRFIRLEATFESEVKSVREIKEELVSLFETQQERIKVVDNKIVIHSIQLGEMSKDIKDINTSVTSTDDVRKESIGSLQKKCQEISNQLQTYKENSDQVSESMIKSIASVHVSSQDVDSRTSTIEKIIDTMSLQMEQFHNDHTTTRGDFMEQHQSIETSLSAQVNQLTEQINGVQQTTRNDARAAADTMEQKFRDHEGKIDRHETTLSKVNALTQSVILKHESIESNVACLQVDVKDIKLNVHAMNQAFTSQLNEHVSYAKGQLQHICDVAMPEQLESNKLLRARFLEVESRMKERHEKAYAVIIKRVEKVHENIATINGTIDELEKTQKWTKSDLMEMKQIIEKATSDIGAVADAFTLEVAHRSELQAKLSDMESSIKVQSAESRKLEYEMESHVTEIRQKQDQSTSELNRSLTQLLALSQMKEAMMKQVADCLTRLSLLDSSTTEHKTKFQEVCKEIADHEVKLHNMAEASKSMLSDNEKALESYKIALDALSHDVQRQCEIQRGVNDLVSQSVATCTVSISEIEKRTTSITSNIDDVTKNVHAHINAFDIHVTEMKSIIGQHDEKQNQLKAKIEETEFSLRDHHEKIAKATDLTTQNFASDLKAKIDRHADRLKTAKDARIVIRNDLKTMVDSMNEQFEQLRSQMEESKATVANHLESMIQTRDALPNKGNDTEALTKVDYLAGKFKSMNESSKTLKETIAALQGEMEQWKDKSEQEMSKHVDELTSKIEFITGKFKSMNEKSKSAQESIVTIKNEMEQYKNDHISTEKTTDLVEEISTKIDYLAGKFKSLSDHAKATNATINSLQEQVVQVNKQQTMHMEQFNTKIVEHEQTMASSRLSMLSMISSDVTNSEATTKTVEQLHKDVYGRLFVEFNDFKRAFDEIKIQTRTPKEIPDEGQERFASQELMKQIDSLVQQVQNLESEQSSIKANQLHREASIPEPSDTVVDQLKVNLDRLSRQVEQNVEELNKTKILNEHLTSAVHGINDRQSKYKKAIIKQHGQLKELASVAPLVKRTGPKKASGPYNNNNNDDQDDDVYHEARDAEEIEPSSLQARYNTEHRDQE